MRISIGIFAHNEEQNIGSTLKSLFQQSLLASGLAQDFDIRSIEILCLANGCRDRTVDVAAAVTPTGANIMYRVLDLPAPGKARTWNAFVHALSDPASDFLILMDADIIFDGEFVLEHLLRRLLEDEHAQVATDTPVKTFVRETDKFSIADRASLAASEQKSKKGVLCGQLYCARAEALRRIWLPPSLPVEDGFLGAMISTSGFTAPDDFSRIAWVPGARHFFRTHRSVRGFLTHEARIVVGSTINSWLFRILWEEGRKGHTGDFVKNQNQANPGWLSQLIDERVQHGGAWLIPAHFMLWRLEPLKHQRLLTKIRRTPIALAATALNLLACVRANAILKRENAAGHW